MIQRHQPSLMEIADYLHNRRNEIDKNLYYKYPIWMETIIDAITKSILDEIMKSSSPEDAQLKLKTSIGLTIIHGTEFEQRGWDTTLRPMEPYNVHRD